MKEVENEVDLVELQKEIDKRKVEDEKKKKSCYKAFDMVNYNLGSGISTKEGVALGHSTDSSKLSFFAQENYPQAFNYQDYEGEFYTPMGVTVKIIPGSSAKDFKKWTKDAKAFNKKVEKYIDETASNEEISEEYAEVYKAITTDRINRTLEGYSDDYISSKTPLGSVNSAIDACSTGKFNKESDEMMKRWNKKFPLWSYYKNGEKQLRTLTEYWKEKEKNKGELSAEIEDKYRKQLYETTVKMVNYQQKMMSCVTDPDINKQLVDDNVFDKNNNPYHIHGYSARGITATYKTHETYKACLENGWAIDDIALVAAFSTYLSYTESCVMSKRSALSLKDAKFWDEPKFNNDPENKKLNHYKKAVALYEKIKISKLKNSIDRENFINEMSDIINEAREKNLYFSDGANNTSSVFGYFDQVKKDVDFRTKLIDAGLENATFNTDFTKSERDIKFTDAVNKLNVPRTRNRESDEHKNLREAVEGLQNLLESKISFEKDEKAKKKVLINQAKEKAEKDPNNFKELTKEQIDKISIFNSKDAAMNFADSYLAKLDEVVYKSRLYQKEKAGTSSPVGLDRLNGAKEVEAFAKMERNRLLKQFIKQGFLQKTADLHTFRVNLAVHNMEKAYEGIMSKDEMPKTKAGKENFNSMVADIYVSKMASMPSNRPLIDVMGNTLLKEEIMKDKDFKKMMDDYYKDKTMTPAKLLDSVISSNKLLEMKNLNKTVKEEAKFRNDKAKEAYDKLTKNVPKR